MKHYKTICTGSVTVKKIRATRDHVCMFGGKKLCSSTLNNSIKEVMLFHISIQSDFHVSMENNSSQAPKTKKISHPNDKNKAGLLRHNNQSHNTVLRQESYQEDVKNWVQG